jgi:hypothetical protein
MRGYDERYQQGDINPERAGEEARAAAALAKQYEQRDPSPLGAAAAISPTRETAGR